jgi:bla regulator protein blaR1
MVRTGTLSRVGVSVLVLTGALALPMRGQSLLHPTDPLPSFEVATVKLNDPKVMVMMYPPGERDVFVTAGPVQRLVQQAFNVASPSQRIIGVPAGADKAVYRVEGKIPEELFAKMQTMTGTARMEQAALMLQSLLADRFKLKMHFETREMPIYELVVAKGGPKLPPPNDETPPAPGANKPSDMGSGGMVVTKQGVRVRNMTLDGMLQVNWYGLGERPIVNHTGLTGKYNLLLNWTMSPTGAPAADGGPEDTERSIFTVLQEQLGLKLVPGKGPVEVVVIDSVEEPSAN